MNAAANACLACRRVKMKCCLRQGETICDRCMRKSLECVFQEHRRGRKPGVKLARSRTSNRKTRNSSIDETTPAATSSETNDTGSTSLQPSGLLNSNAIRDGRFSLLNILANTDNPVEKEEEKEEEALFIPAQDPIRLGLINESIAGILYESFINVLNPYISQLDPNLHTFTYTRQKCSFLLSAVLAVSAKMFNPALYKPLLRHAEDLFMDCFRRGAKSTEIAQSILILTYWKEPDDTRTWVNVGYVIRMVMDLGWHRFGTRPPSIQGGVATASETDLRKTRNEERTWFVLFVYDRSISLQTGKPWMIERNKFIEAIDAWCRDPLAIENDVILGAFVTLRLLTSEVFRLLGSWRQIHSSQNMGSFMIMISNRIDEWEDKWLPLCAQDSESPHYFLIRFYGTHLRLQLHALPLQEILDPNSEHDITYHQETLWTSLSSAVAMLKLVAQYSSRLYFAQDSVHVMTAYSAAFLIKVLLSAPPNIAADFEPTVIETIRTAAVTLSEQSPPLGSSCFLQQSYLEKVLSNYDEAVKKRNESNNNQTENTGPAGSNIGNKNHQHSSAAGEFSHNPLQPIHETSGIPGSMSFLDPMHDNAGFLGPLETMDRSMVDNNGAWTNIFSNAGLTVRDFFPSPDGSITYPVRQVE
ncbi:protein priB, putative [Talaromyces stipitatus ATCC 10500]|uniref:Protein priB, putative n=1 Tax=Talaromyces stipitatus (strain ATCC 10500 / CBS 375.48 / QM 6759 / NRRL 1006) TaxID=441959 RepID=B8M0E3_TALSN|nr:protein priB, putative [Talaromyces stipitatus ATCC 10500]EED21240.1 protein priB, putative [Talaromyces stipitatus ATCC 10500]